MFPRNFNSENQTLAKNFEFTVVKSSNGVVFCHEVLHVMDNC